MLYSRDSLLEFDKLGARIELSDDDEDLPRFRFRFLWRSLLRLATPSVLAWWCLVCLRYFFLSDVRGENEGDFGNAQELSVIFTFCLVSCT